MDEYDAADLTGSADESRQGIEDPYDLDFDINLEDDDDEDEDELDATVRSEPHRRSFHGRGSRHVGEQSLVSARRRFGSSASGRHGTKRVSPFVARGPGGRFDAFNTFPSHADGSDSVTKLVIYGA